MEFNLTTFILELINFLALVWVLKRLFYGPVQRAIEERRRTVQKNMEEADKARIEARGLQAKYENRLKEWESEKAKGREELQKEMGEEKERQLKAVWDSAVQERGKLQAQEEKRLEELSGKNQREALRQSVEFASRILSRLASPETEQRIIALALERLPGRGKAPPLFPPNSPLPGKVTIHSAYPLPEEKKKDLRSALGKALGAERPLEYVVEKELLAGLSIDLGVVVLKANLRDELQFFAEAGLS